MFLAGSGRRPFPSRHVIGDRLCCTFCRVGLKTFQFQLLENNLLKSGPDGLYSLRKDDDDSLMMVGLRRVSLSRHIRHLFQGST